MVCLFYKNNKYIFFESCFLCSILRLDSSKFNDTMIDIIVWLQTENNGLNVEFSFNNYFNIYIYIKWYVLIKMY